MRWNPTVALAVAMLTAFAGSMCIASRAPFGPAWGALIFVQFMVMVAAYTIGHDAVHRVASRRHWLNELLLLACGAVFLFDGKLFRRIHLLHHAHTHDKDDPDRFTSSRYLSGRVARSALLALGYYRFAVRKLWWEPRWRMHLILAPLLPTAIISSFAWIGRTDLFLGLWLTPLFLAEVILGVLFSSLPHDVEHDRTRNLRLPRLLGWALGNGHLHLAHHKYPRVQWYRLPRHWRDCGDERIRA